MSTPEDRTHSVSINIRNTDPSRNPDDKIGVAKTLQQRINERERAIEDATSPGNNAQETVAENSAPPTDNSSQSVYDGETQTLAEYTAAVNEQLARDEQHRADLAQQEADRAAANEVAQEQAEQELIALKIGHFNSLIPGAKEGAFTSTSGAARIPETLTITNPNNSSEKITYTIEETIALITNPNNNAAVEEKLTHAGTLMEMLDKNSRMQARYFSPEAQDALNSNKNMLAQSTNGTNTYANVDLSTDNPYAITPDSCLPTSSLSGTFSEACNDPSLQAPAPAVVQSPTNS